MKKCFIMVALISVLLSFAGCSRNMVENSGDSTTLMPTSTPIGYVTLNFDWPYYSSVKEIVEASTNVYSGKVTDISFEIIDMENAKADQSPSSKSSFRLLCTIYTIEVSENFKGNNTKTVKICKEGGVKDYETEKQYDLMKKSGLFSEYNGILLINSKNKLEMDKEYLFCMYRTTGDYDAMINPEQFAYELDSETAKAIINSIKTVG